MTFNSEFPQTLLNEVLSITAQESATARRGGRGFHVPNEVLSITAQELFRLVIVSFLPGSSMKS